MCLRRQNFERIKIMIEDCDYEIEHFVREKNSIKTINKYDFVSSFENCVNVFIMIIVI